MSNFDEFAKRLPISQVLVDGSLLQLSGAVIVHGQRATLTGQPGHTWWRLEGTLGHPLNASPDVAVRFVLDGKPHSGRGSVEPGTVSASRIGGDVQVDSFPVTIQGSGDLDPEL